MTTLENLNGVWPRDIGHHHSYPRPLTPPPAVVLTASVMFLAGLAGAGIGLGFYKLTEWITGRHHG